MFKRKSRSKKKYAEILAEHKPSGYRILRRNLDGLDGVAKRQVTITLHNELEGNELLFVALHEFGHIYRGHLQNVNGAHKCLKHWQEEYEADQYAIAIMRQNDVPIPAHMLSCHKKFVREAIERDDGSEEVPIEILKYAYGKNWRKHQ